jgi:hypothetical protein
MNNLFCGQAYRWARAADGLDKPCRNPMYTLGRIAPRAFCLARVSATSALAVLKSAVPSTKRSHSPGLPSSPAFGLVTASLWLPAGNQMTFPITDQVGPPHTFQGLAQQRPVVGIMIT